MILPGDTPPALEELVQSCFLENPESRPNFKEVYQALIQINRSFQNDTPIQPIKHQSHREVFINKKNQLS